MDLELSFLRILPHEKCSVVCLSRSCPCTPLLARLLVVVGFPFSTDFQDRVGAINPVDWIAVDLDFFSRYGVPFRGD